MGKTLIIIGTLLLAILLLLGACAPTPAPAPKPAPRPAAATSEDIEWLATVIASEAGSIYDKGSWIRCTDEERAAVGWTVINRLKAGTYGDSIKDIVSAPAQYAHNQQPNPEIKELAKRLLQGQIEDVTGGATHFFSPISMPKEGESTSGFDTGGGLHTVTGIDSKVYFPSWAETMNYVGSLKNVRSAYFMFYRGTATIKQTEPSSKTTEESIVPKTQEMGKTPDNPVPLETPLRMEVWSGAQELTVLKAEFQKDTGRLLVDIQIRALENATYYGHDFRVVGSKGVFYETGFFHKEILAGATIVEKLIFSIPPDDSTDFFLVWRASVAYGIDHRFFTLEIPKFEITKRLNIPETTLGKTQDNPVPLGTPLQLGFGDRGSQEVTVLEAELIAHPSSWFPDDKQLLIKIQIKALEDTRYKIAKDFPMLTVLGMGAGVNSILYGNLFEGWDWKEIIASNSVVVEWKARVTQDFLENATAIFLVWSPKDEGETRYFALED